MENKESITVSEFKAWLSGLIRGKNGQLPNIEDWKVIKTMLDKVKEVPPQFYTPYFQPNVVPHYDTVPAPTWAPGTGPGYWPTFTCGDNNLSHWEVTSTEQVNSIVGAFKAYDVGVAGGDCIGATKVYDNR